MEKFMDILGNICSAIAEGVAQAVEATPPDILGFVVIGLVIFAFVKSRN